MGTTLKGMWWRDGGQTSREACADALPVFWVVDEAGWDQEVGLEMGASTRSECVLKVKPVGFAGG